MRALLIAILVAGCGGIAAPGDDAGDKGNGDASPNPLCSTVTCYYYTCSECQIGSTTVTCRCCCP